MRMMNFSRDDQNRILEFYCASKPFSSSFKNIYPLLNLNSRSLRPFSHNKKLSIVTITHDLLMPKCFNQGK